MSKLMHKMLHLFNETFKNKKNISKFIPKAKKYEIKSDQMQEQISTYISECTKHELSFESSKLASAMIRLTNELESVGDSTLNLFLQIERLENDIQFTDEMNKEIIKIYTEVNDFFEWNNLFISDNIKSMSKKELDKSINFERTIDDSRNKLLESSRIRLINGSIPKAELLFMDIIKHLEHIGDYSLNISQALEQID